MSIDFTSVANSYGLFVQLRSEQKELWVKTLSKCPYIPVIYTNDSVEYQIAYQGCQGGKWADLSAVIFWDKNPVAVWPLSLTEREKGAVLSSHGLPVLPPLFTSNCPRSAHKRILSNCLDLADSIANSAEITSWESQDLFINSYGLSPWHLKSIERGAKCSPSHDMFLDLRPDISEIWKNFNNYLQTQIRKSLKIYTVNILDKADETIWQEFRKLHFNATGRITRSKETWDLQLAEIEKQKSLMFYIRDDNNTMVSGLVINFTRDEGMCVVGAYERSLISKPMGYCVSFIAFEELKRRGVLWFKLGQRNYLTDNPFPNYKGISISEFKEGFSSHLFPKYHLTHKVYPCQGSITNVSANSNLL